LAISRSFYERLSKQVTDAHCSDCSILTIIDWIKENLILETVQIGKTKKAVKDIKTYSRVWLHFHHIYATDKRQKLVSWALDLGLCGFLMAGKPGMVCAEGLSVVF
jgi:hypothetical protein